MDKAEAERLFSGIIGEQYDLLKTICPAAADMSLRVGQFLGTWRPGTHLNVFEIGCGTGITTLAMLNARDDLSIVAVDNEPAMLQQAQANLAPWLANGQVELIEADALSALQSQADGSVDVVASGYAIHNFLHAYRREVHRELFRVLKPGGVFVNGDRYGLDDTLAHTRSTQDEARHYFKVFGEMGRLDLLEQWIVHLFSDESEDHLMRLRPAVDNLKAQGFAVDLPFRDGVNTLLIARKN